jgi:hypothetical protein
MSNAQRLKNTLLWGFTLWLIGFIAGIILFFIVPKDYIGWVITPLAILLTIWVLVKKIKRPKLMCYFGLGLIWTVMAVMLDFIFLVMLFNTGSSYYKSDVFLYYILIFTLPIIVGYWKFKHKSPKTELF